MRNSHSPTFAVVGTGNSGQTFAADIALKGFSVNLAEVEAFAANLHAIESRGGIELTGDAGEGFARLNMMTTDLAEAIRGVDVVIVGGSAHAHEPISKALAENFEDGQFVLFTANFGALRFRKWMDEAGVSARVTPVETMSLLYATRAVEPGKVQCIGLKTVLPAAAFPATRTAEFLELVEGVFPQFVAAQNVLSTSFNSLNPVLHPPLVLFSASRIELTGGEGWNLQGEGATEAVCRVMLEVDAERLEVLRRVSEDGMPFQEAFERLYADYELERETLSETLRFSPIHSGPELPAPTSLDSRYLTEDVPFGLVPWSELGRMWGVPTPTMDAVIRIASAMVGVEFADIGLRPDDLGIRGMTPEQVRTLVA
ncbi:MAG: NAD/NADP-dependent octopine/nopaline dehydrogenase family protein [Acidimicrobiia bacterium]|nr:MAG: NAD/NADP-dependent octopine/nopaline dehydrogenase family protein [Acidimicrobiia bacterium]